MLRLMVGTSDQSVTQQIFEIKTFVKYEQVFIMKINVHVKRVSVVLTVGSLKHVFDPTQKVSHRCSVFFVGHRRQRR